MVGAIPSDPSGATVNFSHSAETAQAGYYAVTTTSPDAASSSVTTELTTAMRSGIARFTFPASSQSDLLLKVADSELKLVTSGGQTISKYKKVFGTSAQVIGDDEVTGSVTVGHFCNISDDNLPITRCTSTSNSISRSPPAAHDRAGPVATREASA
jgi:putative alpha-1,2-mannosidase